MPGGTDQEITFRVPVEQDGATVGLRVALPADAPIGEIAVRPVPGWTHEETRSDPGPEGEVVTEISWAAEPGKGLRPGEYGAFTVIAGRLPDTTELTFRAVQIYDDGSTVEWTQTQAPGDTAELDRPAPVLVLGTPSTTAAASGSHHDNAATAGAVRVAAENADASRWTLWFSGAAFLMAWLSLGLTLLRRARDVRGGD
ncbi:hypothetical protein JCM9957A_32780 [Kineosporia succinea]